MGLSTRKRVERQGFRHKAVVTSDMAISHSLSLAPISETLGAVDITRLLTVGRPARTIALPQSKVSV